MTDSNASQDYAKSCIEILASKGFKRTKTREYIANVISGFEKPFGPKDVHDLVSKKSNVDFATVYRNFQIFSDCDLLHPVGSHGKFVACSKLHCDDHAVHTIFRCKKCHMTQELVEVKKPTANHSEGPQAFKVESSVTEVTGICAACAASS